MNRIFVSQLPKAVTCFTSPGARSVESSSENQPLGYTGGSLPTFLSLRTSLASSRLFLPLHRASPRPLPPSRWSYPTSLKSCNMRQCSQWPCTPCTNQIQILTLVSSSEQQTSKLCLKIHIRVSQPSTDPPPKILIIPGNIFKIIF